MSGCWNETVRRILADDNRPALSRYGRLCLIRAASAVLAACIAAAILTEYVFSGPGVRTRNLLVLQLPTTQLRIMAIFDSGEAFVLCSECGRVYVVNRYTYANSYQQLAAGAASLIDS